MPGFPRTLPAAVLAAVALSALAVAPTDAAKPKTTNVTFMTRNLFLGADLIPLATTKGDEFERAAGNLLNKIKATDPEARMKLVAGEIAKAKPDLVGLQEVTLWRTGTGSLLRVSRPTSSMEPPVPAASRATRG